MWSDRVLVVSLPVKEIEKSTRHGRTLSILEVAFAPLEQMRSDGRERAYSEWLDDVVRHFSALQRSSDVLAFDGEGRFLALLPEADALGATLLKRRAAEIFESVLDAALAEGQDFPVLRLAHRVSLDTVRR